ncbi:PQQ-binding-like beta-propeller repeat protein [bacterium]|nr:PQQ-binding-like beta-propeller repeat protein [bacterium]
MTFYIPSLQLIVALLTIGGLAVVAYEKNENQQKLTVRQSHTGVHESLELKTPVKTLWNLQATDVKEGTTYAGCVYLLTDDKNLQSFDAKTGEHHWDIEIPTERTTGLACSANEEFDFIAVSHYDGLALVERHSGAVLWSKSIIQGLSTPVIYNERIFAASPNGKAYAFDLNSGEILWEHDYLHDAPPDPRGFDGNRARFGDKPARPGAASTDGKIVYFSVFDQCRVVAIDCLSGERHWAFNTQGWMLCRPAISEKYVLAGSQDDHVYCIDKETGKEAWKFKTNSRVEASPSTDGEHVFIGSCDANLYCLDIETGEKVWHTKTEKRKKYGGPIYEQAFITKDVIYLPSMEGQVYALNKSNGKLLWQVRPSEGSEIDMSFTDGKRLFAGTRLNFDDEGDEAFYCLGK